MSEAANANFRVSETIHETILNACRRLPEKPALVSSGADNASYTFGQMENVVSRISGGLRTASLHKGDRVGILSENCPEWGLAYLSILASGGTVVPLDSSLKPAELTRFLRVSGMKILFCSSKWYESAHNSVILNAFPIRIISFADDGDLTFRHLLESEAYICPDVGGEDTAILMYTSGTTGDPKGVILTHRNIVANLESIAAALEFYTDDVFLSVLPLHHTFEATCGLLIPLSMGLKVVYVRSLKSRDILNDMKEYHTTYMVAVPLLYEKLYAAINRKISELPLAKRISLKAFYSASRAGWRMKRKAGRTLFRGLREKASMGSIRMLISGGAPLPERVGKWFNLVGFDFLEGYGMTECSPVISVNRPNDIRFGSVGPPLPNIDLEIDNPSSDGVGEIKVKGPNTTAGYLNNPEATADLIRDGWLYTGDMGRVVNSHLNITGRKKNLIVSGGGKNIYPEEVESELNLSEYILESLVVGRKKADRAGEEVWALIVPDIELLKSAAGSAEGGLSPQRIRETIKREVKAVNNRISDYKRITNFEIRTEEFEKTSTKKIKRNLYS
jgi:long-chain acyl-CoA synthetase